LANPTNNKPRLLIFGSQPILYVGILTQGGSTGKVWQEGADPGPPEEEDI